MAASTYENALQIAESLPSEDQQRLIRELARPHRQSLIVRTEKQHHGVSRSWERNLGRY